ncbi:hypothetical protein CFC21_075345 [Triticum aestivum]|uniref:MARVEL domain-containing protein n=3 Tax=Triticinae TaxID=1648030 RepID=A0A9R1HPP9_WHEAT|nr:uncharacterized protein LOC109740326 [Aegilops tauschii subsp. strangulata]XP_044400667.1 uncharacterized protein LOC123124030 [Triticum aestivum]XP_044400669.1 uncharacterized protein LOC123124030 [Triticum aestivum]XP_044400670.1 uncharacterized protein LOC123124030 [Triticum aestivum]XP_044400671.1 uncharacterized protein LOC123124030 [Triticum aestivum]XP_044400672.1 uncharacterized protein LOC123124030 [Triticum aestivum]KAF7069762.1 hypothetical protein CFC21_075345 [Triticum aestivu
MDTERLKRLLIKSVVALAIAALILYADATRPKKPEDIRLNDRGECVYPMSLSFVVGLAELAVLLGFVSYFTFQHGWCCVRRDGVSVSSFALGIFLAILSWLLTWWAVRLYLRDVGAIWPGRRGKPPECYAALKLDHHHLMANAFKPFVFALALAFCSSKKLSPPPPIET